ncbi:erythromycin esterase family protein [Streptomyces sp. NPDC093250]|uniref:erythromycin esterase family protein n=1 Tax=Streptomyces sp. NPDC093250 TaxID=3366036 RepID=UPI0037F35015
MSNRLFSDRADAGRVLAKLLERYRGDPDVIVLGLPRGGVPVAYEVATALDAPLDIFLVRKLGVPGQEEVAMGAIADGGVVVLNEDVVRGLGLLPGALRSAVEREARELLRQEQTYREGRLAPELEGRTVILVDDGLATGASMRAAIQALRRHRPARIVAAVPAAPESTCRELADMVDDVVCATTPSPFFAVGESYWDFRQVTDEEVRELLRRAASRPAEPAEEGVNEVALISAEAFPVEDGVPSDEALFDLVGDAHFVLIGEASHGTHDFYQARARMTQRLIEEKGFCAVAAEADWPDAYRVNRYVRGHSDDVTAEESLRDFERFPTWMWRNTAVLDFVGWLREHNDRVSGGEHAKAGFYGLDLYSLYRSIEEVINYLDRVDPEAAKRARERYACFDHYNTDGDAQAWGFEAAFGAGETCEQQVVDQLVELQRHAVDYARRDGLLAEDDQFYAEQNARTVKNAAEYYRTMFGGQVSSWNLRDRHMVETLEALAVHLSHQRSSPAKIVVWEHNSHLGDARSTEATLRGEFNVGQLVRQAHPENCCLLGFTTYTGTVTAADDWGGPAMRKAVRPALVDSVEDMFHQVGEKEFLLPFNRTPLAADTLRKARLERAIGVIYRPQTERQSHYFHARVSDQFDGVIHIDETRAVEPLERTAEWQEGEVPETYPFAV